MLKKKSGYDIFLGGTTNESTWREKFISIMKKSCPTIKMFNPIVDNWTPECIELEEFIKDHTEYHVYVITPRMLGVYSIAEMVNSCFIPNKKVFYSILDTDIDDDGTVMYWSPEMKNSLAATSNLLLSLGAHKAIDIPDLVNLILVDYNRAQNIKSVVYRGDPLITQVNTIDVKDTASIATNDSHKNPYELRNTTITHINDKTGSIENTKKYD